MQSYSEILDPGTKFVSIAGTQRERGFALNLKKATMSFLSTWAGLQ